MSEFAVACARENARRNGLSDVMECVAANVFDLDVYKRQVYGSGTGGYPLTARHLSRKIRHIEAVTQDPLRRFYHIGEMSHVC